MRVASAPQLKVFRGYEIEDIPAGVAVLAFVFWKLGSFGKRSAELKAQKAS
jgi:hypothetical protein